MSSSIHRHLTAWSLLGLGGGLLIGSIGRVSGGAFIAWLLTVVEPFGQLWVNALQALVLPLVLTHMLAAIIVAKGEGHEAMTRVGVRALLLFVGLLVAGGLFTVLLTPPLLALYPVDPDVVVQIESVAVPPSALAAATGSASLGEWVSSLLPGNVFAAAAGGDILSLLLFTVLFGAAVTKLPSAQREPITRFAQGFAAAMLILVRWVLTLTPFGVFAFTLSLALQAGGAAVGLLGAFVAIQCALMLGATVLLYPLSAIAGRVPLRAFAQALGPAQVVAVSTRSSIAALPALLRGARERLGLSGVATGFVLPFSNSLFKLNRTVSSTAKVMFLAHIYGIALTPLDLASFIVTIILMSFSGVGVPGGGSAFRSLPAYLAAGVPIAGVVILEAADTIPDVFKTLLNVTGQMSAATLLDGRGAAPA